MTDRPGSHCGLLADGSVGSWVPHAGDNDCSDRFPASDIDESRDIRLRGLLVPERLGGLGGSFADHVSLAVRLGAASGSSALLSDMHASVIGALAGVPDSRGRTRGARRRRGVRAEIDRQRFERRR